MSFLNDCSPGACLKALRTSAVAGALVIMSSIMWGTSPALANHAGAPSGDGIVPIFSPGNPTCSSLFPGTSEFKINAPADGTFTGGDHPDGPLIVTIDVSNSADGQVFDWSTSNSLVQHIVVKGGPDANLYNYPDPGDNADTFLHSPVNHSNGKFYGLSHISFCYVPGQPIVTVDKECPAAPEFIDGGTGPGTALRYTYTADIENESTGGLDLFDVQVKESLNDCTIVSVGLNGGTPVATSTDLDPAGSWVAVQGFTEPLAFGDILNLTIQCESATLLPGGADRTGTDTLMVRASRDDDSGVFDTMDEDTTDCALPEPPDIAVDKVCADPVISLVEKTLADGTPILAVQKHATINVRNLGDEAVNAILTDDDIPELMGAGQAIFLAGNDGAAGGPDEFSQTYWYLPDLPTGDVTELGGAGSGEWAVHTETQDPAAPFYQFLAALFSNTATVEAVGVVTGDEAEQSRSAHCSICYSNDPDLPAACPDPDTVFPDPGAP